MTPEEIAAQAERDRRRRENELLLALLLLMLDVRRDTAAFLRYDQTPDAMIQTALTGRGGVDGGAVLLIARYMADAHRSAYRRLGRLTGRAEALPDVQELLRMYAPHARQAAAEMARVLSDRIRTARVDDPSATVRSIVRDAFDAAGFTEASAHGLDVVTERAVVTAYNVGMLEAAARSGEVRGLRHVSILDDGTTDICRSRHDLALPVSHPYWRTNVPALHWRCRSVIVPIIGRFEPSAWLPSVPPMPGFGAAPPGFLESLTRPRAA
jgi:SPP1 gp7 family putative phage head morphogenesis protein